MMRDYYKAVFGEEGNSRFICTVVKDGQTVECYISSSSKLSKYLPLANCNVLISKNERRDLRTRYTLEAVECANVLYYVNFNKVNKLYENYLLFDEAEDRKIYKEYSVSNIIKTDFYIENHGCIEIKALLSKTNRVVFPDNSSHRLERQLLKYIELLKRNIHVSFCFIAMSDSINEFELNAKKENIGDYFSKAISLGMKIKAYSVTYEHDSFKLIGNLTLENNILKAVSA